MVAIVCNHTENSILKYYYKTEFHFPFVFLERNSLLLMFAGLMVTKSKTEFLYVSNLEFFNVTKKQDNSEYVCYENNNTLIPLGKLIIVSGR